MAKIVTANTLATGHVVFLAAGGRWVAVIGQAETFADDAAAEVGMDAARQDQERSLIVDPFVVDIGSSGVGSGGVGSGEVGAKPSASEQPRMTLRDTIRAFGPTIRYLPPGTEQSAGQG